MKRTTDVAGYWRWVIMLALGLVALSCNMPGVTAAPQVSGLASIEPSAAAPTVPEAVVPSPIPSPAITMPAAEIPLSDIAYRLPLTIRHVTTSSATLFFELASPAPGSVFLRSAEAGGQTVQLPLDPGQTRHLWTVDGLEPANRYEVVVALESAPGDYRQPQFASRAWGPVGFRTAAESGTLRFGVISDASFGDAATIELVQAMANANLDFVLHAGDVVDETEQGVDPFQSYAGKYYTPFEPLLRQMPVYTAIGNHDYDADIRWEEEPFYYHAFPPFPDPRSPGQDGMSQNQYYAFVYQDIRFIILDSQALFGASGREEQETWLADRLTEPGYRATIPMVHVAPFSSSSVHVGEDLPVRYTWVPVFEAARVPVVFSGHFHHYERLSANGVTYITTGGGSSTLYAPGNPLPESIVLARRTHFVLAEIDGKRLKLTAITLEGDVIDQVEIALP